MIARLLRGLASTRLTLLGMVILAAGAGLSYDNPADVSIWVLVVPLGLLALNLFAAIVTNPGINRRPGLLMFHIGLFSICILAAIGRLSLFEAHLELRQGEAFEPAAVADVKIGPWHHGALDQVHFVQGGYTVEYNTNLVRGRTHNRVSVEDGKGGWSEKVIGDDRPLVVEGYRFYTTFNKGFSAVMTWMPEGGAPVTGAVNMPSYPLFEYRQDNHWTPPGGDEIKFWLRLDTGYTTDAPWVLDLTRASGKLVVTSGDNRVELSPGDSVALPGGRLRYEQLSSWMGYKIFYDPTLKLLFAAAMMTVLGLFIHYWRKFADQPLSRVVVEETR